MGVHYHLLGRIPQLGGYHRSKDRLFRALSSLWQDHQILRLCRRDPHKERERLSLLVPLNHLLNPQHLAAVRGILMTVHLAVCSGKCWCVELLLRISEDSELIPPWEGLRTCREIILCQIRLRGWVKIHPRVLWQHLLVS